MQKPNKSNSTIKHSIVSYNTIKPRADLRYRGPGKPTSCNHPIVDWSDHFKTSLRKQTRRLHIMMPSAFINSAKALFSALALDVSVSHWVMPNSLQVQGQHLFHLEEPCSCFSCSAGAPQARDHAGLAIRSWTRSTLFGRERILVQNATLKNNV